MNIDESTAVAHLTALARTTPDALVTIDTDSRIRFVNPAIEDVLGYAPDELRGESLTTLMAPDLAERHLEALDRYLTEGTRTLEWENVELPGKHADGHEVPLSISFSEFTLDSERYFTGVIRDVTDSRRQADNLERLHRLGRDLSEATSVGEACETAVLAAADVLDLPLVRIERYDAESGSLIPCAHTDHVADLVGDDPLFPSGSDVPWDGFVLGESRVLDDLSEELAPEATETPLSSAIVEPIGEYGVLIGGSTDVDAPAETDIRVASILVETTRAAFDRLDREESLRGRTSELETKNEQLERLRRINDEIRDITQALMDATSREEIKRVVCERLARADPYRFVWFGERDLATEEIRPTASAGVEDGYLDAVEISADTSDTGRGAPNQAIRTHEPQVQNDLRADPPFEPWRREAMDRGYRASIAVPVLYNDTLYGLLNLYANESGVFTEREKAVLSELGEVMGYALNGLEQYDALVSEESIELKFVIRDFSHPLLNFLREAGGRVRLENIGTRKSGSVRVFLAFEDVEFERIRTFFDESGAPETTLVSDRDDECIVEVPLAEDSVLVTLLERGAMPTDITASSDAGQLTLRIPRSASVREFVDAMERRYDDVELVARREIQDPVRTTEEFERAYADRLTDRQREVLQTAYVAGFFEQPRDSTAEEIAEMLDVSQPTVSRHLRHGQRKLFSLLFGDGRGG